MANYQNPYSNMMTVPPMRRNDTMDWSGEVNHGGNNMPQTINGQNTQPRPFSTGNMRGKGIDLQNNLPEEVVDAPMAAGEVYMSSLKSALHRNKGNFIVATFLIGTQNTVVWEGILHEVGNDYIVLYQAGRDRYIVGDIYSLKFIEFYDMRQQMLCDEMMQRGYWPDDAT